MACCCEHKEKHETTHCCGKEKHEHKANCCCCGDKETRTSCSCCGSGSAGKSHTGTFLLISLASLIASFLISYYKFSFPGFPLTDPAWIAVALCGFPIVKSAFNSLFRSRKITTNLLISTAIFASIALQFFMTFSSGGGSSHHDSYIFAAGEIAFLMALGEMLEERTVKKSRDGIEALVKLSPKHALRKLPNGAVETVPVEQLAVGDIISIKPDDMIPADGEIIEGTSAVNQASMTGESLPIDKTRGDNVLAGTWNLSGALLVRVAKLSGDTAIARLVKLVKEAESKKAPIVTTADRWAKCIVPAAIVCSILVFSFAFWVLEKDFTTSLIRGVTILVVFCPCAFALATPTAIAAGIGNAAKRGILIKSGAALEKLAGIKTVAFDKTGTLTCSKLKIEKIHAESDFSEKEILTLCAAAERHSQHPIARAVSAAVGAETIPEAHNATSQRGAGISCEINGRKIKILSRAAAILQKIPFPATAKSFSDARSAAGETLVCLTVDNSLAGIISLSDTMREKAPATISDLRDRGVHTVMLTGDNKEAAHHIANIAGIDEVFAEQLPTDKAESIKALRSRDNATNQGGVLMVGDGVNDAPALASADCSAAMGALGSELAVETADIAIMNDNIELIGGMLKFSRSVMRTIHTNFALSLCINFTAVILSASGVLTPVTGAIVHNISSVLVVMNSASLLARKKDFNTHTKQS